MKIMRQINIDENTVIVITGASSGIGKELAIQLSNYRPKLVLTARREKLLNYLKRRIEKNGAEVLVIPGDIRKKEVRERILSDTISRFGKADVLINNAGLGKVSKLLDQPEEEIDQLIETNFIALVKLTQLFLPVMKARNFGHIVNVSSSMIYIPNSAFGVYCATKAAIKSFSDAIRNELKEYGISVSTILPGPYKTNFNKVAGIKDNAMPGCEVNSLAKEIIKVIERRKKNLIAPKLYSIIIGSCRAFPPLSKLVANFVEKKTIQLRRKEDRTMRFKGKKEEKNADKEIIKPILTH